MYIHMAERSEALIRRTITELLERRGPGKTICPSDAARAIDAQGFRKLMPAVRDVAQTMVRQGTIVVTQRGEPVDIRTARGPVRLKLSTAPSAGGGTSPRE
jgi:hypothetical protein